MTNGPQGTVTSKTARSVSLVEKGLARLENIFAPINPEFKIKPEVENLHAVTYSKHQTCTVTMQETLGKPWTSL